jgi:5-methylcytosine-specific restriction protein B
MEIAMPLDLKNDEELQNACESAVAQRSPETHADWVKRLTEHLQTVREASHETFVSADFQKTLWESESVSATGMGHVDLTAVLGNAEIIELLWQIKNRQLPSDPTQRAKSLISDWDQLEELIVALDVLGR